MVPYETGWAVYDNSPTSSYAASTLWMPYGTDCYTTASDGYSITWNKQYNKWLNSVSNAQNIYNKYMDVVYGTTEADTTTLDNQWRTWVSVDYRLEVVYKTPAERLRQIIQSRQAPTIIGSRKFIGVPENSKEVRARETLLRVLGEEKYRGFLRNGFVSVRGKSGKVYQIFPGHGITKVYQNGQLIDRLCVVLQGSFPPTDALIMRFLLILNDEAEFYRLAVKHGVYKAKPTVRRVDLRPLPEIYRGLVAA